MQAKSNPKPQGKLDATRGGRGIVRSLQVSASQSAPQWEGAVAVEGTIEATVAAADWKFYSGLSEALERGMPVSRSPAASPDDGPQLRTKDLIAELDSINAQIHRIMSQVERAVAKLASSGRAVAISRSAGPRSR